MSRYWEIHKALWAEYEKQLWAEYEAVAHQFFQKTLQQATKRD